jgi:lipopolysaccharide/colanic/teichoic acid biosynthesis glycosyltransferase
VLRISEQRLLRRRGLWQRRSFQLGGALMVAVFVPWVFRALALDSSMTPVVINSAVGSLVATVVGFYLYRSMTAFPGLRPGFYILPLFSISFGIVLFGFLMFRQDYSRFIFFSSYVLCCMWFLGVFFMSRRGRTMSIALVPCGDFRSLLSIEHVQWVILDKPSNPRAAGFDAIAADFRSDQPDDWERFLADCALSGVPVYHTKQLRESITGRVEIEHLSENSFGSLIPNSTYRQIKLLVDLLAALPALVVLAIPMLLIGLAIRLDSRGPALFRQPRVGQGGQIFEICKFRTMHVKGAEGSDAVREAAMTKDADPRVTRLGRFLRHNRIDELPQIINILRGEMSWIGPRPEALVLAQWYESELPFYAYRHIVRPGITGWAQVRQGHVTEVTSVNEKLQYDFYYIKNFSPWLDIVVVSLTVGTILTGFGSR